MVLQVKKGDLFKNLNTSDIFLHSCNGQGVWGSGIAASFYRKFPKAYEQYKNSRNRVGDGYVIEDGDYKIGCLITSRNFGKNVDSPNQILINTYNAIYNLLLSLDQEEVVIHSPKINSGLFKTPWQKTKKVIKMVCEKSDKKITWIVWEL